MLTNIICHDLYLFCGIYRFAVQLLSLTNQIVIQILIIHDIISSQVANKRRWGFDQWMN